MKLLISSLIAVTLTAGLAAGQATKAPAKAAEKVATKAAEAAPAVDINSASKAELEKLPAIGPAIADKIIKGRPFAKKDQLVSKSILTQAAYDKIKDLIVAKQK